ncbi:hypothetical protein DUNSADRAFT_9059 [Dunaliella salina]|uniref:Encoded protein n=1 Tax=Dunaliella salina TaxID=3046 RepID=A0ABQ7GI77_DUNSA|nr:hypothetical protein DUNSADRAFT_9059 [Dunaliella salina]|eukprot:KAF5834316.1 hypothetical protein DUNSADRAFT_9059 [Dunaliella salina]
MHSVSSAVQGQMSHKSRDAVRLFTLTKGNAKASDIVWLSANQQRISNQTATLLFLQHLLSAACAFPVGLDDLSFDLWSSLSLLENR